MSRWAATALSLAGLVLAWTPAGAQGAIARPDPVLAGVHLDYESPLKGSSGEPATLNPLAPAVSRQAVSDERYLYYHTQGDLGGFVPATVGESASFSGGRAIVGSHLGSSQIPQYGQAAEGVVRSFAFVGSARRRQSPQNGRAPVAGLGIPPEAPLPSNSNAVPPPNEGFGGRPVNRPEGGSKPANGSQPPSGKPGGGGSRPGKSERGSGGKSKHPPGGKHPPATTPATTPTPAPPPAGEEEGQPSGSGGGASCGTVGLAIASDHSTCRIYAVNMEPGQSASETMTVRDEAGVPFTLSLRASGEENRLWNDLRLGVWQQATSAPDPLPALLWWTTQDNVLATLQPDQAVSYEVELYLPASAGNEDQGLTARIDLTWSAHQ